MLAKYTYHYGLVKMLSKRISYDVRSAAFMDAPHDAMTRRDYAEHLLANYYKEIE